MALYLGNQKVCPVISVGGGGGSSGYTLKYMYNKPGSTTHITLVLNETTTHPLASDYNNWSSPSAVVNIPNIEKITISGDDGGYWYDSTIEFTTGGVTRAVNNGETITLTQDATLYISECDCLLKGTIITMADGSFKEISTIKEKHIWIFLIGLYPLICFINCSI